MNEVLMNQKIKKSQSRMITTVTSVDGQTLAEAAPGLKNEFENYSEAFKLVQKAIGRRPNLMLTKRVGLAAYSIRS